MVEAEAARIASMHGASLKEVAAAMALKHDAEVAMLEPMQQDLALGTALVENARTEAAGIALLNHAEAEAGRIIASHSVSLSAKAEAYKTLKAAEEALLEPMEREIELGKDLVAEDATRAMGVAQLSMAETQALQVIAANADKPTILAKGYHDLREAQDAFVSMMQKDVSDGAVLIGSYSTRAQGIDSLNRAEEEARFILADKTATTTQLADATKALNAAELAMLAPLLREVAEAREMSASDATRAAGLRALAQAEADAEARLATLTMGTPAYAAAQRSLSEAITATIMALEGQAKADEKGAVTGTQRSVTLAKLAMDEAALKALLQQTNLSYEERETILKTLQGVEEKQGDFSMRAAEQVKQDLQSAQASVQRDIQQFGVNTGTALNDALDAGIKAGFAGKNPMKAMENSMLSSMGNIFSSMGAAMIKQGLIMIGFEPALADPFTSGPAALAVGALLEALGATLGGIMQGDSSGSSASVTKNAPQTTNTTYFQTGAGGEAGNVQPQPNYPPVTIIGHNDPQAQRDLGRMMENMAQRGIKMGN
jgi:hypothetical protein